MQSKERELETEQLAKRSANLERLRRKLQGSAAVAGAQQGSAVKGGSPIGSVSLDAAEGTGLRQRRLQKLLQGSASPTDEEALLLKAALDQPAACGGDGAASVDMAPGHDIEGTRAPHNDTTQSNIADHPCAVPCPAL